MAKTQSEFAVAKARYAKAKDGARRQAALNIQGLLHVSFYLTDWSRSANEAYLKQWCAPEVVRSHDEGGWDWPEIFRRYRDIDSMRAVVWTGEHRLSGLALIRVTGAAVVVEFIEGDPRTDCPLRGRRALIVLEAAFCYAQALPRSEVRLTPANERLAELYRDTYGFSLEQPAKGPLYYRKEV